MKVLLEPSIYELTSFELEQDPSQQYIFQAQHIKFLSDTLDYIFDRKEEKCNISLLFTQNQYYNLCNPTSHPWNQYTKITNRNQIINTFSKIMKLPFQIEDVESIQIASPSHQLKHNLNLLNYNDYCKQISYVYINNTDYVVFYGRFNKYDSCVHYTLNIDGTNSDIFFVPICNILADFNESIRKILLSNKKYQIKPTVKSPLPNKELSEKYIKIRDELIRLGQDRIDVYTKVGTEVALRNNYQYDPCLTSINSNSGCIRHIFQSNCSPKIYLSIDIRHGNFEVCDSNGKHVDEYTYNNQKQNKHDPTGKHDIKFERNRL